MEAYPESRLAAVAAARAPTRPLATLQSGLTWRSLLIGVLLTAFISHWSQYAELVIHGTQISLTYPPIGAFIIFVCMYLITNIFLKAIYRPAALTREELVIIFSMLVVAASIASIDLAQKLIPMISGPFYYATEANRYEELFLAHIPSWMAPRDPGVLKGLYEGWAYGIPWSAWAVPLVMWTGFTILTYIVMLCLLTLVRQQWIEDERLLFPLVAVPLEVIQESERGRFLNAFFRNPVMWIGFAAGFLVHFYNGLPGYFPGLPILEVAQIGGKRIYTSLWGYPWSEWGSLRFSILPLIIGLSFLLTREVSFSLWAFYWLNLFEEAAGTTMGLSGVSLPTAGEGFPFAGHQTAGAYLALAVGSLWIARRPLMAIIRTGLGLSRETQERNEPLSYRFTVYGLIVAFLLLCLWCVYGGIPLLAGGTILLICFGYLLAMTRLVSEAGMPWMSEPTWRAHDILRTIVPTSAMSTKSWTGVGMLLAFSHDMRVCPMPRVMQTFKITDVCNMSNRHMTVALAIAVLVAIPVSYWAFLDAGYTHGGVFINRYRFVSLATQTGTYMERVLGHGIQSTDWATLGIIAYGAAKLSILTVLRIRYVWWPLHPVGYAMSFITYLQREWLSVLIGWASQTTLLRYGGHTAFRRARPLFLGLILGAMLAAGVWLLIDGFTGLRDHKILY